MPTFRDIDLEDIPRALRIAGAPWRTLDHGDYAKAIKWLQSQNGYGADNLRLDTQDMSEALIRASGGFGGDVPDPPFNLDLTLSATGVLLTTTRAGTGYADNLDGLWLPFLTNQPRITDKGLLVEEARTNSLPNNSMQGAVAGNPGTLPTGWAAFGDALETGMFHQVVGKGTVNGIDYIDLRFFGTPVQGWFEVDFGPGPIAAAAAQVWTSSLFWWHIAGSLPMFNPGSGAFMAFSAAGGATLLEVNIPPSAGSGRRSVSGTAPANTVSVTLGLYFEFPQPYVPYDFTFRIGWPQVEQGAFMTSPIRTTSAAVTRAADVVTTPASGISNEVTLFAEGIAPNGVQPTGTPALAQLDDGTLNERVLIARGAVNRVAAGFVIDNNVTQANPVRQAWGDNAPGKLAIAAKLNDVGFAFNGSSAVPDIAATMPAAPTTLRLGSNTAVFFGGYLKRVAYWPTRLPDAQLRQATS